VARKCSRWFVSASVSFDMAVTDLGGVHRDRSHQLAHSSEQGRRARRAEVTDRRTTSHIRIAIRSLNPRQVTDGGSAT